jgi:hypothetical protein
MAICGCGSPAHCCQLAVAGGFIYADLRSELNTHLAPQALLLRVLLGVSHWYKLSPFKAPWGRWHCTSFLRPVCLFTVHMGSGPSPLSYGVSLPLPLLQAFLLLISGCVLPFLPSPACLFIYSSHGKWVFPPLLWSFPPTATFTSFPAHGCWVCATASAFSSWLVVRDFPSPPLWHSGHPTLFATCHFCCYCLLFSFFFFFPGWGLVCPGGYADLAQGCL